MKLSLRNIFVFLFSLFFLFLITAVSIQGQTLSTEVFSSEDELYEAFLQGELTYYEYTELRELIAHGVNLKSGYLFDEIPNQVFVDSQNISNRTVLQKEQQAGFRASSPSKAGPGLIFKYRYFRGLDENDPSGYRLGTKINISNYWSGSAKIHREYSGKERFVSRSITYKHPGNLIRSFVLGSFNTRLGLGTVYGRRGNLFDFSPAIDGESVLYPDYGGFNGVNCKFVTGRVRGELVSTINRDAVYRLNSVGGMAEYFIGEWQAGLIYSNGRLVNRITDISLSDHKIALNLNRKDKFSSVGMEITRQFGDGGQSGALLIEGRRVFGEATVKFAGWSYGNSFVNLTSGSKGASLSRTVLDTLTGFEYRDRLSGQQGGLLRTILKLHNRWELTSSVIVGQRKFDRSRVEFMGSLRRLWSGSGSVRADFLSRRTQLGPGSANVIVTQRSRIELRLNLGKAKVRSYISYTKNPSGTDYWSCFARLSTSFSGFGKIELWSNIGRLTHRGINYWYSYLKQMQSLSEKTNLVVKLSHSYSRSRTEQHKTALSLEVVTSL